MQSVNLHNCSYLPLLSEFGIEEVVLEGGGVEDDDGGGVVDEVDGALSGAVDGLIVEEFVDDDGDGVTTGGGAFGAGLVDVWRLQPATPSTSPVQSKTANAFLIAISTSLETGCPSFCLAGSVPCAPWFERRGDKKMPKKISAVADPLRRGFGARCAHASHAGRANFIARG